MAAFEKIITEIEPLNVQQPNGITVIHAKQSDGDSRFFKAVMYNGTELWSPATSNNDNVLKVVRYKRPDGYIGFYDTMHDGTPSVVIDYTNKTVTFGLVEEALGAPGKTLVDISFFKNIDTSNIRRISTFNLIVEVESNPAIDGRVINSRDYVNVLAEGIASAAALIHLTTTCEYTGPIGEGGYIDVDPSGPPEEDHYNFHFKLPSGPRGLRGYRISETVPVDRTLTPGGTDTYRFKTEDGSSVSGTFEVYNGMNGRGTVNSVDGISPANGQTDVQLHALRVPQTEAEAVQALTDNQINKIRKALKIGSIASYDYILPNGDGYTGNGTLITEEDQIDETAFDDIVARMQAVESATATLEANKSTYDYVDSLVGTNINSAFMANDVSKITEIRPAADNLIDYNTLQTPGNYLIKTGYSYIQNSPTGLAHKLTVSNTTASNRLYQIIQVNNLKADVYIRSFAGNGWSPWMKLVYSYQVPIAQGSASGTEINLDDPTYYINGFYQFYSSCTFSVDSQTGYSCAPKPNDGTILYVMYPNATGSTAVDPTSSNGIGCIQILFYADGETYSRRRVSGTNNTGVYTEWRHYFSALPFEDNQKISIQLDEDAAVAANSINSANAWATISSYTRAYILEVPAGAVKFSLNAKQSGIVVFLRSLQGYDPTGNESSPRKLADLSDGYSGRIVFDSDGYREYEIHDDMRYIYILTHGSASSANYASTNLVFTLSGSFKNCDYIPSMLKELPVLRLTERNPGDATAITKENAVTLNYSFFGLSGTCTVKWQGSSSLRYIKKNYTIKFGTAFDGWNKWATFMNDLRINKNGILSTEETRFDTNSRWGNQTKYCLKGNWVDPTAAKNIVCARLWGQIVKSRNDILDNRLNAPNYGAIDGVPVEIMLNDRSLGLYTLNIPKDAWMFAMGSGTAECVVCGENNTSRPCKWTQIINTANAFDSDAADAKYVGADYSIEYQSDAFTDRAIITSLNNAIQAAVSAGSNWETTLAPYLDIDSVFDYFIFTCCVNNHDALARNIIYATYDGVKWFMSAYDLDTTFGADAYGAKWLEVKNDRNQFAEAASMHKLANLMLTHSKSKLKQRYNTLRKGILSDANVWRELSNFMVNIPEIDYELNRKLWPSMPGTSTANLAQYMDYYRMHCAYLDEEIDNLQTEGS